MSKRIAKLSGDQKKEMFWASIHTQTLANLRDTLAATGIEAHTRNEATEKTSLMEAAMRGRQKSLDTLLDWYERRRELRSKGWIDLKDEDGRTALMLAAMEGQVECMESLLKFGAKVSFKDDQNKTWLELAEERKRQKAVEFIHDHLKPAEVEELVEEEDGSVLTSTQRNKLKKRELQAKEEQAKKDSGMVSTPVLTTRDKTIKPKWDEVQRLFDSFDELKPIHDVVVNRPDGLEVDPALFTCHWLRVVKLSMGEMMTLPNCDGLVELQQLILTGSVKLKTLPVFQLTKLRVLEAEGCGLETIPKLSASLEVVNVSNNKLQSVEFLQNCVNLQSLNLSGNQLTNLEGLPWESMSRLADVKLGRNRLIEFPKEMGNLVNLVNLEAEENLVNKIPLEFLKLKKLRLLTLNGNPIQDPKLLKICNNTSQKSPKDLFSKLEKLDERESKTQKKSTSKKKPVAVVVEENSDLELDDDEI
ncbi:hypothetical protein BASA81_000710 [Batrachochytrium salamandrivorans]|nr:hypothetical protein BASA81_000710 [Batrachochytrium salamandrivorans]